MPSAMTYPVHVEASLDPRLSRWLWLVKWVLAIPHYIVLFALWIAFAVLSIVAFFSILFTGHYPRKIFEFNVGVLRWSWRVDYYSYGALATDHYPPFTLAEVPDYPAHLEIDYPDHLSRGLVLVKWWLLAIPHYIIVGFFIGGGTWLMWQANSDDAGFGGAGLITILAIIAAFVLLFTGRYPGPVFDFVLGMNRWVLRVAAYAGLMTDRYPPFRLDLGGHEPGGVLTMPREARPEAPPTGGAPPEGGAPQGPPPEPPRAKGPDWPIPPGTATAAPPPGRRHWTGGRIVSVIIGSVLLLASLGFLTGGASLLWADRTQREGGFLTSDSTTYATNGYAVATEQIRLWDTPPDAVLGDIRVRATAVGTNKPIFIGIGPAAAVNAYLAGVGHTVVEAPDAGADEIAISGGAPRVPPAAATGVWTDQVTGSGTQELVRPLESGRWVAVAMNADGSPGLAVRTDIGAEAPVVTWIAVGLIVSGLALLLIGTLCIALPVAAVSRAQSAQRAEAGTGAPPPAAGPGAPGPEGSSGAPGPAGGPGAPPPPSPPPSPPSST